jgi:hypothetical protein
MINDPSLYGAVCYTHALGELVFGPHSASAAYFRLARRAPTGARFAVERIGVLDGRASRMISRQDNSST